MDIETTIELTVEPMDVGAVDIEGWLDAQGGAFEISYRYLRSRFSLRPKPAFVGAWMSLHTDDRGGLATWGEVAGFLGVARQTVYGWRGVHRLDDHAELLRLARLRGDQLGEVDRVTYYQAVGGESSVAARRLYYERAGVLGQPLTLDETAARSQLEGWLAELRDGGGDEE